MGQRRGPWRVTSSREVYRNPWLAVREDAVVQPDGDDGVFGVVELKPGVSVLPVDDDGNVYLVRIERYAIGRPSVEVISGGIDGDKPAQEAAARELREEGGIVAHDWVDLGVIDQLTEVVVAPNHLFLATGLEFVRSDPEGSESLRPIKVPLDVAVRRVLAGEITHAVSMVLILKARHHLDP